MFIGVTFHRRYMIGTVNTLKANLAISPHTGKHIRFAIVVKSLDKIFRRAAHVPHMDKEYLALLPKTTNHRRKIVTHHREVALTQRNAVYWTWHQVEQTLV